MALARRRGLGRASRPRGGGRGGPPAGLHHPAGPAERRMDGLAARGKAEPLPPGRPVVPPLQAMFPPVHRVPIYVAGYRSPIMVVAGQKGDGYLARPAESIPGLQKLLRVMRRAAKNAGRDPQSIDVAGYLLTFIDETRRAALNRSM